MSQIHKILEKFWGHKSFRPQQQEIIESLLANEDSLALLPTSAGKSVCFQIPALVLPGVCIVVTPLIALMKNQVENLRKKRIWAEAIYSGIHPNDVDRILDNCIYGQVKLLYVSPERLKNELFLERFAKMNVNLLAVDEAHCVSDWGYDFRPSYQEIHKLRDFHPKVPMIALTASATAEVTKDIIAKLKLKNPKIFKSSFARTNIHYLVRPTFDKEQQLLSILQKQAGSVIIYVRNRKRSKDLAEWLQREGHSAAYYHAGLDMPTRDQQQQLWLHDKVRIIVATNAFGMGIDKPNVRLVVHWDIPDNLEAYYQEAGRAGRDGLPSYALVLFQPKDVKELRTKFAETYPSMEDVQRCYQAMANALSLAEGSGYEQTYAWNPTDMAQRYSIDEKKLRASSKMLQYMGLIQLNEAFYEPSKMKFVVNNTTLYDYRLRTAKHDVILKSLFQLYGADAFEHQTFITETKISSLAKIPEATVKQQLLELNAAKIIDYTAQNFSPSITYLTPRKDAKIIGKNDKIYHFLKDRAWSKLNDMLDYLQNEITCRQQVIVSYFNESDFADCGICDVCLERKQVKLAIEPFVNFILSNLRHQSFSAKELAHGLSPRQQKALTQAIEQLLENQQIEFNKIGKLALIEKG
jgi:ATP-dependent DNA helicase RecQ